MSSGTLSLIKAHEYFPFLPQQVFLWIGAEANATEKERALTTAEEYLHTHPSGRDPDTPILIIKQGFEPPTFTGWFLAWDSHIWSVRTGRRGGWGGIPTARELGARSSVGKQGTNSRAESTTFPPPPPNSLLFTFLLFATHHGTKSG